MAVVPFPPLSLPCICLIPRSSCSDTALEAGGPSSELWGYPSASPAPPFLESSSRAGTLVLAGVNAAVSHLRVPRAQHQPARRGGTGAWQGHVACPGPGCCRARLEPRPLPQGHASSTLCCHREPFPQPPPLSRSPCGPRCPLCRPAPTLRAPGSQPGVPPQGGPISEQLSRSAPTTGRGVQGAHPAPPGEP